MESRKSAWCRVVVIDNTKVHIRLILFGTFWSPIVFKESHSILEVGMLGEVETLSAHGR